MLYGIFGQYSNQTADAVRLSMLNEVTQTKERFDFYESTGFVCLRMKELSLDEWLQQQYHKMVRGDELAAFILSKLFNRHTMIHTAKKPWCTIMPTGQNYNFATACHMHLLFMGNNMFSILRPKPPPQQALPVAPAAVAAQVAVTTLQQVAVQASDTRLGQTLQEADQPADGENQNNKVSGMSSKNNDANTTDCGKTELALQFDESSNDSSVVNMDIHTTGVHTVHDDVITRECEVRLDKAMTDKLVTETKCKQNINMDSRCETADSVLMSSDSEDVPLSDLFNNDRD